MASRSTIVRTIGWLALAAAVLLVVMPVLGTLLNSAPPPLDTMCSGLPKQATAALDDATHAPSPLDAHAQAACDYCVIASTVLDTATVVHLHGAAPATPAHAVIGALGTPLAPTPQPWSARGPPRYA